MSLTEVLNEANKFSRVEKIRLMQMVAETLATDEIDLTKPGQPGPVWSPFNEPTRRSCQDEKRRAIAVGCRRRPSTRYLTELRTFL